MTSSPGLSIGKSFTFEASHQLHGLPAGHKCSRLHGHSYTVTIELTADQLVPPGFVTDFAELAPFKDHLADTYDHRHLNNVLDREPTVEHLATHLFAWCVEQLEPALAGVRIVSMRVQEGFGGWAEVRAGER